MDKYTKELLALLKEKFTEVCGEKVFQNTSEMREFYLKNLDDNLYRPMDESAFEAYGKGSGSEIDSGKMNALRSSSALTYNLFWNQMAELTKPSESGLGSGVYKVEFEKQFRTLKKSVGGNPANLDAFLVCGKTNEAVAVEMKMMEWIFNKPGELKAKYLDEKNYIDEEAGKVFVSAAKELIRTEDYEDSEAEKASYPSITSRHDAFQMFKHAVACYTAIISEEPRKIEKLTVVDKFGVNQNTLYRNDIDKKHFTLTTKVIVSDRFYAWLAGFGSKAKIISPSWVVEGFKEYINKIQAIYEEDEK